MRILFLTIVILSLFCKISFASIPNVKEIKTPNGLKAWVVEDDFLPIISLKISFKNSGSAYDPDNLNGLSKLVASTLDEGAADMNSSAYNEKLEELATSISFSQDDDRFSISLKTLTENLIPSLEILKNILQQPRFDDDAVARVKGQIISIIESKKTDPSFLVSQAFAKSIFGNHPYSRSSYGTVESVTAITKNDLVSFVKNNFTQENITISVVGHWGENNIKTLLDQYINLPKKGEPKALLAPIILKSSGVKKEQAPSPQSVIAFGVKSVKRDDKNFYPFYLMNHILGGGGFESRLMHEVREKNGLVYGIYSYLNTYDKAGILLGSASTENKNVEKSIELIKQEFENLRANGVSKTELQDAKNYLINSFPLKMTKNENIASFLDVMQHANLGIDFFEKRNSYVESVTKEQIDSLAKEYLKPENLHIAVSGGDSI